MLNYNPLRMYNPSQIANYFIKKYGEDPNLTPMKIIKLVYIAHGWYLGLRNTPLINEPPQAWKFGPVIPSLYYRFKHFKNSKIVDEEVADVPQEEDIELFLDKIWSVYGGYDGVQLSSKTHQPNTPWSITWKKATEDIFIPSLDIPDDLIKSHYKQLIG